MHHNHMKLLLLGQAWKHTKSVETAARYKKKIQNLKDQIDWPKSEKEGIKILIEAVESKVTEAIKCSLNEFICMDDPILTNKEFFDLIELAENVTPNMFQQQYKAIMGSGRYQDKDHAQARAFFMIIASLCQGNHKLFTNWTMILVLANAKEVSTGQSVQYLANLGFQLSPSTA